MIIASLLMHLFHLAAVGSHLLLPFLLLHWLVSMYDDVSSTSYFAQGPKTYSLSQGHPLSINFVALKSHF